MIKSLFKTSNGAIQKEHKRMYSSGKVTIVNRGISKKKKIIANNLEPRRFGMSKPNPEQRKSNTETKQESKSEIQLKPRQDTKISTKNDDRWIEDTVNAIQFPVIASPMWQANYPDDIKKSLSVVRLAQLMKDQNDFRTYAHDFEALGYISTASHDAPLRGEWTDIYRYLFTKWSKFNNRDIDPDIKLDEINDYKMRMLKDLKIWIRKKQYQHMKETKKVEANDTAEKE